MSLPTGVPLEHVQNPFDLDVHRPIQAEDRASEHDTLPLYIRREHDQQLSRVVAQTAGGASVMAILVGESSAGKTRACWEALGPLRQAGGWRLWHFRDQVRKEAILAELPGVGPRTVVWLNEAQEYLSDSDGERVAARLRGLLADPARAPVLILATLWPVSITTG